MKYPVVVFYGMQVRRQDWILSFTLPLFVLRLHKTVLMPVISMGFPGDNRLNNKSPDTTISLNN